MPTEHERIEKNTEDILALSRKLEEFGPTPKNVGTAHIPTIGGAQYSFLFGGAQPVFAVKHDSWEDCEDCDNIYENKTGSKKTVTVKIHNSTANRWDIDLGDGVGVVSIPGGKTKTITVEVPAGKVIHTQGTGKFDPDMTVV